MRHTTQKESGLLGLGAVTCQASTSAYFGTGSILRVGDSGPQVNDLQADLNYLGFDAGPLDGQYGELTEGGVIAFQQDAGITVDGVVGPETKGALCSAMAQSGTGGNGSDDDRPNVPGGPDYPRHNLSRTMVVGSLVGASALALFAWSPWNQ